MKSIFKYCALAAVGAMPHVHGINLQEFKQMVWTSPWLFGAEPMTWYDQNIYKLKKTQKTADAAEKYITQKKDKTKEFACNSIENIKRNYDNTKLFEDFARVKKYKSALLYTKMNLETRAKDKKDSYFDWGLQTPIKTSILSAVVAFLACNWVINKSSSIELDPLNAMKLWLLLGPISTVITRTLLLSIPRWFIWRSNSLPMSKEDHWLVVNYELESVHEEGYTKKTKDD